MKCLVPVKRVVDFNVKLRVKANNSDVETEHVKMAMNPFDEIALEEAVRLKESGLFSSVIAVSVGKNTCSETLRVALARGADRALLIETNKVYEPLNIAKFLQAIVNREQVQCVIMGKQAIDDDCNQTGQMLSGLLGWSQATYASKLEFQVNENRVIVTREVDGGLEVIAVTLPTVITVDLRLNEPRYLSLPNVMKAKTKPLDVLTESELGLDLKQRTRVLKVEASLVRRKAIKVANVKELVDKLRNEAKVI